MPRLMIATRPILSLFLNGRHHIIFHGKKARIRSITPEYALSRQSRPIQQSLQPVQIPSRPACSKHKTSRFDSPATKDAQNTLIRLSQHFPSVSGLQIFSTGWQLMKNMGATMTSMTFRVKITPRTTLFTHSVQPDDEIRRRNKANDTLDHTEAAIYMTAEMTLLNITVLRAPLSTNWTWRPSPHAVP